MRTGDPTNEHMCFVVHAMSSTFIRSQGATDAISDLFDRSGPSFSIYVELVTVCGKVYGNRLEAKMLKTSHDTAKLSEDLAWPAASHTTVIAYYRVYDSPTANIGIICDLATGDVHLPFGSIVRFLNNTLVISVGSGSLKCSSMDPPNRLATCVKCGVTNEYQEADFTCWSCRCL